MGVFLMLNGCSANDTPATPEVSASDADGASAGYIFNQEGHGTGTTIVVTIVNASVASAIQGLQNTFWPKMQVQTGHLPEPMPSSLLVSNNPYEKYGILHNRFLNIISENGGVNKTINDLSSYDSTVYFKFLNAGNDILLTTDADKIAMFHEMKANNIVDVVKQRARIITGMNSTDKMIEAVGLPSTETNTLKGIRKNCQLLMDNNKPKEEVCKYLNTEISKILENKKALTHEAETELVYLTVLKHSIYYWN